MEAPGRAGQLRMSIQALPDQALGFFASGCDQARVEQPATSNPAS